MIILHFVIAFFWLKTILVIFTYFIDKFVKSQPFQNYENVILRSFLGQPYLETILGCLIPNSVDDTDAINAKFF